MYRANTQIDKKLLYNGMEIKNWKSLCELQNWKCTKSTNSRATQEKTLNQVCKWHKKGHMIFIDSVFYEIEEREDNRKDVELSELKDIICRQIIRTLANQYNTIHYDEFGNEIHESKISLNMTMNEWIKAVGLANDNFINSKKHPNAMFYLLDMKSEKSDFYDFLNNDSETLSRWVNDSFKKLSNERSVVGIDDSFKLRIKNEDENTKDEFKYIYRDADYNQARFIKACEGIILSRYKTNIVDVLKGASIISREQFYSEVLELISNKCYDEFIIDSYGESVTGLHKLKSYYKTINISLNPMTINLKYENTKELFKNDQEVLDMINDEIKNNCGTIRYLDTYKKIRTSLSNDNKEVSERVINRICKNSIKRLGENKADNVMEIANKLHDKNAEIICMSKVNDFNKKYIGAPNPFDNDDNGKDDYL